jgi:hypothetical protein
MRSKHDDMSVKHWETRSEKKWEQFKFNQPYERGLKRLREEVLAKTNFDPATLWQWGTMQAMALIEILKKIEEEFGSAGQRAVFDSLYRVGYDVGRQMTKDIALPDDITDVEFWSFYATVINRIAYASLESPKIVNDKLCRFHIDWCPHQDHYTAFDCRVQRYFVQGMIDSATDYLKSQGRNVVWDVTALQVIPTGRYEECYFEIEKGDPANPRKWTSYSDQLEKKALEMAQKGKTAGDGEK